MSKGPHSDKKKKTKEIKLESFIKVKPISLPDKIVQCVESISYIVLPPENSIVFTSDEYQGLSYKSQKPFPSISIKNEEKSDVNKCTVKIEPVKKNSIEKDFRVKFKTEKCKFFESNKECKFGDNCAFAHGVEDIREKVVLGNNYKTKRCKQFFESGYCPYGSRCQFLHRESPRSSTKFCPQFSYTKTISDLISSPPIQDNFLSDENQFRPRLKTFENLAKEKNTLGSKHKLFEDILSIKREDIYLYETGLNGDSMRSRFMSA